MADIHTAYKTMTEQIEGDMTIESFLDSLHHVLGCGDKGYIPCLHKVEELKKEIAKLKEEIEMVQIARTNENVKRSCEIGELKKQMNSLLTEEQKDEMQGEALMYPDEACFDGDDVVKRIQNFMKERDTLKKENEKLKEENAWAHSEWKKEGESRLLENEELKDQIKTGIYMEEAYYMKFCGNDYEGGIEEMSEEIEELKKENKSLIEYIKKE
jgi:hypothetical protein